MLKAKHKRKLKRGTKFVTNLIEATGIPHGYSLSIAWFAERAFIASFAMIVLSFAAGAMFVLRLSQPIADSQTYDLVARKAQLAEQGLTQVSQQVIDIASPVFANLIKQNREVEAPVADELVLRKEKLKNYLESKNSPFAKDDQAIAAFAESKNMKMMVAISFVESTLGKRCYYFNCSGITGKTGLRKYNSYAEWIRDFDDLLERRYKNVPPEDFIGLYVVPGTDNWLYGVNQILAELNENNIDARV